MPQVSEKVLAWLYNVLQTYLDQQRTYSDAARILQFFPSLSPRTEVYTYDSGAAALLLTFTGTLPVGFRGTTYHFPIKLWIPQSYPQESPMAYVVPDRDLQIRAGQHVGVDGRVYHTYLRDWNSMWDRASIADLLEQLQQAFAREPPVISRSQQQQYQRSLESQTARGQAAAPSLPPKPHAGTNGDIGLVTAPPRPPKPGEQAVGVRDVARDGPPLPPLPGEGPVRTDSRPSSVVQQQQQAMANMYAPRVDPGSPAEQYEPREHANRRWSQQQPAQNGMAVSPLYSSDRMTTPLQASRPASMVQGYAESSRPTSQYNQPYQRQSMPHQRGHVQHMPPQALPTHLTTGLTQPQQAAMMSRQVPSKQPAPDLLSDPFDIAIPAATSVQAPPIPPNPEKEHILQALSATLVQQAQQRVNQSFSAVPPLQAQQQSLRAAHARLEVELAQLEALDTTLASNEAILHRSIQDCDRAIAAAKSKRQPPIDDVLIAPTVVAQQLWTASAEEAACREAMYALQNAVDRGRISGVDFVRQMRGLGRECFLKMALARKCAQGLGLEIERH